MIIRKLINRKKFYFYEVARDLQIFWNDYGCKILEPCLIPMGAGTYHPTGTFFHCLSQSNEKVAFIQPCCRPYDWSAENKLKYDKFHQFQVILPEHDLNNNVDINENIKDIFKMSLEFIGFQFVDKHDLYFRSDKWESASINAYGNGFEVQVNGLEVAQITIIQTLGGINLNQRYVEFAYGIDRLVAVLQTKYDLWDIRYSEDDSLYAFLKGSSEWNEIESLNRRNIDILDSLKDKNNVAIATLASLLELPIDRLYATDLEHGEEEIICSVLRIKVKTMIHNCSEVTEIYRIYETVILAIYFSIDLLRSNKRDLMKITGSLAYMRSLINKIAKQYLNIINYKKALEGN